MAQIKIYGTRAHLDRVRDRLSDIIHEAAMAVLGLPEDKRFHRFLALEPADFKHPADRGPGYTIIEISMFEGRSAETKKALLHRLMAEIAAGLGLPPNDIEITIVETPQANWGIRGRTGDELDLSYKVET